LVHAKKRREIHTTGAGQLMPVAVIRLMPDTPSSRAGGREPPGAGA